MRGSLINPTAAASPTQGALEEVLQYRFADPALLRWALTHRSLSYELAGGLQPDDDPRSDNEQLEFLGDAVLGLTAAALLLAYFPGSREGELTRLRATLVSRRSLASVAARLGLGNHLRLGRGEERTGGRDKPALLANAFEAVLGAVFLDSREQAGLRAVTALVAREVVEPALAELREAVAGGGTFSGAVGDHKSALQERLQAAGEGQPRYVLADESGPDHQKHFRVEVYTDPERSGGSRLLATADASTKKEAQQQAARRALEALKQVGSDAAAQAPLTGDLA